MADAFSNLFIGNESSLFASSISFISFYLACLLISLYAVILSRCSLLCYTILRRAVRRRLRPSARETVNVVVGIDRHWHRQTDIAMEIRCRHNVAAAIRKCNICRMNAASIFSALIDEMRGGKWRKKLVCMNQVWTHSQTLNDFIYLSRSRCAVCRLALSLGLDNNMPFICFWFSWEFVRRKIFRTLLSMKLSNYRRNNIGKCNGLKWVLTLFIRVPRSDTWGRKTK